MYMKGIMMRKLFATLALAATVCPLMGADHACQKQEEKTGVVKLDIIARIDWQYHRPFDELDDSQTGFKGRYLMLKVDGEILPGLSYSWRQRLNKTHFDQAFFDATDWLYVNYAVKGWNFQAGKEVVAIGGWEYDRAPYNLFGTSVFWNNIPCFQLGVSAGYNVTEADRLTAQVTQSPFFTPENRNLYSYNLMWSAHHGVFDALYSANLIEYIKGHYINYLALGNKFTFGKWGIELDLMNRASSRQAFLFKDSSVMGEVSFSPSKRWTIHAKVTYDVNKSGTDADYVVTDGTELTMAGGGVEFYPLKKQRTSLRLHANAYYSWGKNANAGELMQSKTLLASVGLTWDMNLLNIKRK